MLLYKYAEKPFASHLCIQEYIKLVVQAFFLLEKEDLFTHLSLSL